MDDLLPITQAAALLGVTRQALTHAAKLGQIGRKVASPGAPGGWVYMITPGEIEAWKRRKERRGRPKGSKRPLKAPKLAIAPAGTVVTLPDDKFSHLAHTTVLTWCGLEVGDEAQQGQALLGDVPVGCSVCLARSQRYGQGGAARAAVEAPTVVEAAAPSPPPEPSLRRLVFPSEQSGVAHLVMLTEAGVARSLCGRDAPGNAQEGGRSVAVCNICWEHKMRGWPKLAAPAASARVEPAPAQPAEVGQGKYDPRLGNLHKAVLVDQPGATIHVARVAITQEGNWYNRTLCGKRVRSGQDEFHYWGIASKEVGCKVCNERFEALQ